jgi:hypothetical protein
MARATGFTATIGTLFIGRGVITSKGIVPPKDGIKGELYGAFMDELEKRAIRVLERVEVLD